MSSATGVGILVLTSAGAVTIRAAVLLFRRVTRCRFTVPLSADRKGIRP